MSDTAKNNVYRMEPVRKTVNERLQQRNTELEAALKVLIHNDAVTQKKIKELQAFAEATTTNAHASVAMLIGHHQFWARTFLGRLRWLILGK